MKQIVTYEVSPKGGAQNARHQEIGSFRLPEKKRSLFSVGGGVENRLRKGKREGGGGSPA